jgi:predicted nucleic acid-binding Zn ribbon protein
MSDFAYGKPSKLGNLLQSLVRKRGLAEESTQKELDEIWKKTAGPRIGSKSFVRRLRAGVLEVGVTNGTILEELTCYLKHELLTAIQQLHPDPPINSLKFVKVN